MPTTGWFSRIAPVEPKNAASPKLKMPPSPATNQYPNPLGVDAMPTTGRFNGKPPAGLNAGTPGDGTTRPSAKAVQYPPPGRPATATASDGAAARAGAEPTSSAARTTS